MSYKIRQPDGNRHNAQVALNEGLEAVAKGLHREILKAEDFVTPEQDQFNQLTVALARMQSSLDGLRKVMQPRFWEAEVSFGVAAVSPQLAVDLPVAATWFQLFTTVAVGANQTLSFYDYDGNRAKITVPIVNTASGPTFLAAQGIMFRKNLSLQTSAGAPFPLYVIVGGIII